MPQRLPPPEREAEAPPPHRAARRVHGSQRGANGERQGFRSDGPLQRAGLPFQPGRPDEEVPAGGLGDLDAHLRPHPHEPEDGASVPDLGELFRLAPPRPRRFRKREPHHHFEPHGKVAALTSHALEEGDIFLGDHSHHGPPGLGGQRGSAHQQHQQGNPNHAPQQDGSRQ
ncbi:hypothetical protein ACLESO_05515 [Pyxidicoccus sp. 3LG]